MEKKKLCGSKTVFSVKQSHIYKAEEFSGTSSQIREGVLANGQCREGTVRLKQNRQDPLHFN